MNLHLFKIIARNNLKLQFRNLVLRIFFLFILVIITYFHVRNQSNISQANTSYIFTLASFIPFMNAYMFSILQIIPMIFIATSVLDKRKRIDTMDTIYYRPESNTEYIWGTSFATIFIFSIISILSLFFAAFIHLFASDASFNTGNYLYYFLTLVLPSIIFTYGFSLFVSSVIHSRLLCITVLLIYFSYTILYLADYQQGLFNPTGTSLPNACSEIIGHVNLLEYFLQRGCWLFLGLGCIQLAILKFERLPNKPTLLKIRIATTCILIISGLLLGFFFFMIHEKKLDIRHEYTTTYTKYSDKPKATLLSQNIMYEQHDKRMSVKSQLKVQNPTEQTLNEIILYLNPELEVIALQENGKNILFDRENQVIRLHHAISSGDTVNIDIDYEGKLDENICYLDIPDDIIFDTKTRGHMTCYFEKKYAFLEKDFTLLTPEILWYPVTTPPVNPENPYSIDKNFSYYTLQVASSPGKSVISQGEKEIQNGKVLFYNSTPLTGITLCIGEYETASIYVDSVYCELYLFKRQSSLIDLLECKDDNLFLSMKRKIESSMQLQYPYRKLVITESPISFTSYYRNNRGGSEYIQPELIFLPEKGTDLFVKYNSINSQKLLFDFTSIILASNGDNGIFSWKEQFGIFNWNMISYLSKFQFKNNPYHISPMFSGANPYFHSNQYPILNKIINDIPYHTDENTDDILTNRNKSKLIAIDYLDDHSLKQALADKNISETVKHEILMLKTSELLNLFHYKSISQDSIQTFIIGFLKQNKFKRIDFTLFDSIFTNKYNTTWKDQLLSWYTSEQLPKYLIKDFDVQRVEMPDETDGSPMLVRFTIFNDSKTDGIVNLHTIDAIKGGSSNWEDTHEPLNKSFKIKAQTGQKVALVVKTNEHTFKLDVNYSSNIPCYLVTSYNGSIPSRNLKEYSQVINRNEYFNSQNEIVIDNEDQRCTISQPEFIPKLTNYFHKDNRFSKYANLTSYTILNDRWRTFLDYTAYGETHKSVILRLAGKGKSNVEWSVQLPQKGRYEIYVYIPKLQYPNILRTPESTYSSIENQQQQYKIYFQDSVKNIEINTYGKEGWHSLGQYEYNPGTHKVSLSDIGDPDQVIIADAIKWVYIE